MKHLALTAAALLLLAGPAVNFAHADDASNKTNAGASTAAGVSGTAGGTEDQTGSTSDVSGKSQCGDETATSGYKSFSEKCRHQIDAWAASQSGASTKFEGDVAVGATVPDSVAVVEVPAYKDYGYVMLNDKRVLVDRKTHKVIYVY